MANEIQGNVSLRLSKGRVSDTIQESFQLDWLTPRLAGNTQTIQTTPHERLVLPADLTTPGFAVFKNLEAAGGNAVQIGRDSVGDGSGTFQPFLLLEPGVCNLVSLDNNNLFAKALVGPVELQWKVYNE